MPAFAYTAVTKTGKAVKGIETADTVNFLRMSLKRRGIFLTAVQEATKENAQSAGGF